MIGRTDQNRSVIFENSGDVRPGDYVQVKIMRAGSVTLLGELVK